LHLAFFAGKFTKNLLVMKITFAVTLASLFLLIAATCLLIGVTGHYILTEKFYENSGEPGNGIYAAVQKWVYAGRFFICWLSSSWSP